MSTSPPLFLVTDKLEGSDAFPDMPETQYGLAATYALTEKATLALEYLHGTFEEEVDSRDLVTSQVAVAF